LLIYTQLYMQLMKRILLAISLLLIDAALYFFLGLLMMNYEDSYTPAKGPWYSLQSMTISEMLIWFAYQGWFIANGAIGVYLMYRGVRKRKV